MGVENESLVNVNMDNSEGLLVINDVVLQEAKEISVDPEKLELEINKIVSSVNLSLDQYMDTGREDYNKGAHKMDLKNATLGVQAVAEKLNTYFQNFLEREKMSTSEMLANLGTVDSKIADILFAYREAGMVESARIGFYKFLGGSDWVKKPGANRI